MKNVTVLLGVADYQLTHIILEELKGELPPTEEIELMTINRNALYFGYKTLDVFESNIEKLTIVGCITKLKL